MMPERFTLFYLFLCIADIYMLYRFLAAMFEKRYKRRGTILCFLLFAGAAFLVNSYGISLVNLLILPVLYYFYVMVEFQISIRNGIIYTLIFYAIFAGGEVFLRYGTNFSLRINYFRLFHGGWEKESFSC